MYLSTTVAQVLYQYVVHVLAHVASVLVVLVLRSVLYCRPLARAYLISKSTNTTTDKSAMYKVLLFAGVVVLVG